MLTDTERQFLAYALDLAADEMASRGDEFSDEDEAALEKLRRMAAEAQQPEAQATQSNFEESPEDTVRRFARRLFAAERLCSGRPGYHTITVKQLLTAMCEADDEPADQPAAVVGPGKETAEVRACGGCGGCGHPEHPAHECPVTLYGERCACDEPTAAEAPRITRDPDRGGIILHLPEITYLDTQAWAVDIGLSDTAARALRELLADEAQPAAEEA